MTDAVPLTILTGFLGAGKTTTLTRMLREPHGLRIAVLVNDFGLVNIDAALITEVTDDVISLSNGCICCTIRDDLVEAVTKAINRPERPDYIVLEASGVAEPGGILATFADENLRDRIRLDTIACVVDASTFLDDGALTEFKAFQAAFSDLLILNKTDLASPDTMLSVRQWIAKRFHRCRVIECEQGQVPIGILLSAGALDPRRASPASTLRTRCDCRADSCTHGGPLWGHHLGRFETWNLEIAEPLSLEEVARVATRLPAGIYRAKGVLQLDDGRRAVLHVVGKRVDITTENDPLHKVQSSRIVAIGSKDAWTEEGLRGHFHACVMAIA